MFVMNWRQITPTIVTLLAMLAGFLSILITIEGMQSGKHGLYCLSSQLIMLAMVLDGLDGNLARWLNARSDFGAELDTYVDLTAFGIAPAVLIFAVTLEATEAIWRVLLPSAVALSGVVRLARFKVKDPYRGQAGYAGLPITANAAWVALFVFLSQAPGNQSHLKPYFSLGHGWFAAIFLVGIFVFISLQVSNLRYPKPTKKTFIFVPCIVLVALLWLLEPRVSSHVALVMLCLGLIYVLVGPLFVKGLEVHKAKREAQASYSGVNTTSESCDIR